MGGLGFTARNLFRPVGVFREQYVELFSGREPVLRNLLSAFEIDGQIPVVIGDRGIGKSSAAWQAFEILRSNPAVRGRYPWISEIDLPTGPICLWVECEQRFGGFETALLAAVLPRGLRQGVSVSDLYPAAMDVDTRAKAKATFELNLQIVKAGVAVEEEVVQDPVVRALREKHAAALADPVDLVSNVLSRLRDESGREIIIFFDEFDRLSSSSGLGDFIKHTSGVRLVVIGVGQMVGDIVADHKSAMRKLTEVLIPPFSVPEMEQIFDKAQEVVARSPARGSLVFTTAFRNHIVEECGGFAYLAQRIGFESIRNSWRSLADTDVTVGSEEFEFAVDAMLSGRAVPRDADLEDSEEDFEAARVVSNAIGRSGRRRSIVEALASLPAGWCDIDLVRQSLLPDQLVGLDGNLDILVEQGLVERNPRNTEEMRFASPVLRLFVRMAVRRNRPLGRT